MLRFHVRKATQLMLATLMTSIASVGSAVTINVSQPSSSPDWTHFHYDGNSMSDAQIHQAVKDNITQAKSWWAVMFSESRTLNWSVQWSATIDNSLMARTDVTWSGNRPSSATIYLNSNKSSWYIDRTPGTATDIWTTGHQSVALELSNPSFYMPTGFYYSGGSSIGAAGGYRDMLSILLHEMGHAMGLVSSTTNVSGSFYASNTGTQYNNAYIPLVYNVGLHVSGNTNALMKDGSLAVNRRTLPSALDILAVQKAGAWTGTVNSYFLNPFNQNPIHAVPEPGTYLMLACGLAVLPLVRKRTK